MRLWLVVVCGVIVGCAGTQERRGRTEGYRLDSASAACQRTPAMCARMAGQEALLPGARAAQVAASVGTAGSVALRLLTKEQQNLLEQALAECADLARSTVLVELFDGRSPTTEQCRTVVETDAQGRPVTLAMRLGTAMHKVALACAWERLEKLRPGGFSLEPRYLYDPTTRKGRLISREKEQSLLRDGPFSELKGSLVPDVVIHTDDPGRALAVYDFKFPCANIEDIGRWREYPPDSPHVGLNQEQVYKEALDLPDSPFRIQPRYRVIR